MAAYTHLLGLKEASETGLTPVRHLAKMRSVMNIAPQIAALANSSRLAIIRWLKEPRSHFPEQEHADIEKVGVCCTYLTEKLGFAPATTTRHMKILADAGLVRAQRIGKFTYYKRVDRAIQNLARKLNDL